MRRRSFFLEEYVLVIKKLLYLKSALGIPPNMSQYTIPATVLSASKTGPNTLLAQGIKETDIGTAP
jgi:hypothetical protein